MKTSLVAEASHRVSHLRLTRWISTGVFAIACSLVPLAPASGQEATESERPVESPASAYNLVVQGSDQDFVPGLSTARPPAGARWVLVTATIQNLNGPTLTVGAQSISLLDQNGQRYHPEAVDESLQPALVGNTLAQGEWVRGLALFEVPQAATTETMEWCPASMEPCPSALRGRVPAALPGR